jgi:hypothetical protein
MGTESGRVGMGGEGEREDAAKAHERDVYMMRECTYLEKRSYKTETGGKGKR